jgi:outer membrane protein OmpA-like peptidoglycan-associated protein
MKVKWLLPALRILGNSLVRAAAVRERLLTRGIEAETVSAIGRGELDLLIDTPDATAEPRNRRVEITGR